jgi:hypothetical protein
MFTQYYFIIIIILLGFIFVGDFDSKTKEISPQEIQSITLNHHRRNNKYHIHQKIRIRIKPKKNHFDFSFLHTWIFWFITIFGYMIISFAYWCYLIKMFPERFIH